MGNKIHYHIEYIQNGKTESSNFETSINGDSISVAVNADETHIKCIVFTNTETEILKFSATFDYVFPDDCRMLLNGYQSWTDTSELQKSDRQRGLRRIPHVLKEALALESYGDYEFADYANKKGVFHGFSYAYIRRGESFELFGSANERTGFTQIVFDTRNNKIILKKDCEGLAFKGEYEILDAIRVEGKENEVFDSYFAAQGIEKPKATTVSGYTSWYLHYENINAEIIAENLQSIVQSHFKFDIFQIDDGYETEVGDWISPDSEKFPGGMAEICDRIHENDMLAGIWLAPFVCTNKSKIFAEHKDWLLKDKHGNPIKAGHNWGGSFALDFYNPEFKEYLKNVIEIMLNQWDFDLLKLDFLYACCIIPQNGKTRGQIMSEAMDFLRSCAGDKLLLCCGVPLSSAFGKADYCRIGCDVSLSWDDKPYMRLLHRERISTKNCIRNTIFRRQLNGRAFLNDPDVFVLRDENSFLKYDPKSVLCRINHLFGGLVFTSDCVSEYDAEKTRLLKESRDLTSGVVKSVTSYEKSIKIVYELNDEFKVMHFITKNGRLI